MSNPMALDQQLCFALYSASRAMTAMYRPKLDELGVTYPQYLVLLALWERDGRSVGELSAALDLDFGTLSPLLKRLEGAGLVERRRSAADERRVEVTLTERGRELYDSACHIPAHTLETTGLSMESLSALRDSLQHLIRALKSPAEPKENPR